MRIIEYLRNHLRPYYHPIRFFFLFMIRRPFHIGNRYECPLCGFHSKDLAPVGNFTKVTKKYQIISMGKRKGACWKCEATHKEKLVFLYLRDIENLFNGYYKGKILHLAPELGIAKNIMDKKLDCVWGDYFADGYHYPSYVRNMNALCLPFPNNQFDLIICNHVLEHIEDDRKAMSEFYRVLKKGGKAILQVPLSKILPKTIEDPNIKSPSDRLHHFGQRDHVRIYGMDYFDRLEETGFKIEIFNFPNSIVEKYGLDEKEDLYLCHKSL